ncbi:hypothetical protein, partial [Kurthia sibirica]|uniref:hypothetical protein n=1 Tax=Kurthia sibirica TaxID=202750 RepID=UPI001C9957BF
STATRKSGLFQCPRLVPNSFYFCLYVNIKGMPLPLFVCFTPKESNRPNASVFFIHFFYDESLQAI